MSSDTGPGRRVPSQANPESGRNSPVKFAARQLAEHGIDPKDKVYRRYALAVEKALASFEVGQTEWADYISFLARLLKALHLHPPNARIVPDIVLVAHRLAQCLSPSQPSSVHQKALEVYNYLFEVIGNEQLGRDIYNFLPGLAPVLSYAALSVRPLYIKLIQTHFLNLDSLAYRAPLKAIILCLLPGLEDETSEDYDQIFQLVNQFRTAARPTPDSSTTSTSQDSYFWQCFFLAVITNGSRRLGAHSYLVKELPHFSPALLQKDDEAIAEGKLSAAAKAALEPEPGLLIRCLAAGLTDSVALVQRGFLDLLVAHLPLHSVVLQKSVSKSDVNRLVTAAITVLSRRDMSLNRRLWAWLLGPELKDENEAENNTAQSPQSVKSFQADALSSNAAYFYNFGLPSLTRSVLAMFRFNTMSTAADVASPFKQCLSLMDRWEVGSLLIPDIFIAAIESAYSFCKTAEKHKSDDIVRSASQFFDGVEGGIIWAKFNALVTESFESASPERLDLAAFIISRFNIREEEMITHHIPQSILFLLAHVSNGLEPAITHQNPNHCQLINNTVLAPALDILEKLLVLVPTRLLSMEEEEEGNSHGVVAPDVRPEDPLDTISLINDYYVKHHGGLDGSLPPFSASVVNLLILQEFTILFRNILLDDANRLSLEPVVRSICILLQRVPHSQRIFLQLEVFKSLTNFLRKQKVEKSNNPVPFRAIACICSLLAAYQTQNKKDDLPDAKLRHDLELLSIEALWHYLTPYNPKHHVEAVKCLWQLENKSPESKIVEAGITTCLNNDLIKPGSYSADAARRFSILWTQSTLNKPPSTERSQKSMAKRGNSTQIGLGQAPVPHDPSNLLTRPLLIILGRLHENGNDDASFLQGWLQDLSNVSLIFVMLLFKIRDLWCMRSLQPSTQPERFRPKINDSEQCLYYFKLLLMMLKNPSDNIWAALAKESSDSQDANQEGKQTLQSLLIQEALQALDIKQQLEENSVHINNLQQVLYEFISAILLSPHSSSLKELKLHNFLLQRMISHIDQMDPPLQPFLLETTAIALQLSKHSDTVAPKPVRKLSKDLGPLLRGLSHSRGPSQDVGNSETLASPPSLLIDCIKLGFQSSKSRSVLGHWVGFLITVIPLFPENIFHDLIPLVECICAQIDTVYDELKAIFFKSGQDQSSISPEPSLILLLNALESLLVNAHQLLADEVKPQSQKAPDNPQGFFGTMVQGILSAEAQQNPHKVGNNRLTVLLCFQDSVRTCFAIWQWGIFFNKPEKQDSLAVASYSYTALRMRNKARKLLERLFSIETLECLETLAYSWCHNQASNDQTESQAILGLLNELNGLKPKNTIPAIFNAIYSRTNPSSLDLSKQSSLTTELKDVELVSFLLGYTQTLEEDSMDEIWSDCSTFLRDILSNPLPHSQILPSLLVFISILAEKMDKTNFGEQRRTRKELGDLFTKTLTAVFTTRPIGYLLEPVTSLARRNDPLLPPFLRKGQDIIATLLTVVLYLKEILLDNDRIQLVVNTLTTNITGLMLRSKSFPANINADFMALLLIIGKLPQASKVWKKDVSDAFNDVKFFSMPYSLIQPYWLPTILDLVRNDNDRLSEILSRITAPTTAGLVFGVGATSARIEADRRTQLNLRRVALILLSSPVDTFFPNLVAIEEKIVDLISATPSSSPSSATRAEIFIVLRTILLTISPNYLGALWPIINAELQAALESVLPDDARSDKYTNWSIIQAAKLLDLLITLDVDEFQLHEWLYISDTIDAVYRQPQDLVPTCALVDRVSEGLSAAKIGIENEALSRVTTENGNSVDNPAMVTGNKGASNSRGSSSAAILATANGPDLRKPVLDVLLDSEAFDAADLRAMPKQDLAARILKPFLSQLSMLAFEATYSMLRPNMKSCLDSLLRDIFEDGTDGG